MKKFKTGLLALAVVLGFSGALVSKIHAAPRLQDQLYSWTHFDRDGNQLSDGEDGVSISDAQSDYGCSSNTVKCAVGTAPGQDDVTIKYPEQ
jgi:hypothetical protein